MWAKKFRKLNSTLPLEITTFIRTLKNEFAGQIIPPNFEQVPHSVLVLIKGTEFVYNQLITIIHAKELKNDESCLEKEHNRIDTVRMRAFLRFSRNICFRANQAQKT